MFIRRALIRVRSACLPGVIEPILLSMRIILAPPRVAHSSASRVCVACWLSTAGQRPCACSVRLSISRWCWKAWRITHSIELLK
ncbi:hypothetical protein D3C83_94610 [compost metagenome]